MSWWNWGETLSSHLLGNNKFLASTFYLFLESKLNVYNHSGYYVLWNHPRRYHHPCCCFVHLVSKIHEILKNHF